MVLLRFVLPLAAVLLADAAHAACGTRGGPGYRAGGKCVGWDALVSSCGCRSTTTCQREDADAEADRKLEEACQKPARAKRGAS